MDQIVAKGAIPQRSSGRELSGSVWLGALLLSSGASIACLAAGLALSVLSWVREVPRSNAVTYTAVGLLAASFIFLFLTGHCMDRIAAINRARREDRISDDSSSQKRYAK